MADLRSKYGMQTRPEMDPDMLLRMQDEEYGPRPQQPPPPAQSAINQANVAGNAAPAPSTPGVSPGMMAAPEAPKQNRMMEILKQLAGVGNAPPPLRQGQTQPDLVGYKDARPMYEAYQQYGPEVFQERRGELDKLRAIQSEMNNPKAPTQSNYAPMLAVIDSMVGTQYAKTYVSPKERAAADLDKKAALQEKILKETYGVSQGEIDFLKDNIKLYTDQSKTLGDSLGRQTRADRTLGRNDSKFIISQYDSATKDMEKVGGAFRGLKENFSSRDPQKISAALSKFARFVNDERGALSESDVGRTLLPTFDMAAAKARTWLGGKGDVDSEALKSAIEAIMAAEKLARQAYQQQLDITQGDLSGSDFGGHPAVKNVYSSKIKGLEGSFSSGKTFKKKSAAELNAMTPEALKAYEEELKGK